jgi:hypothetical protein
MTASTETTRTDVDVVRAVFGAFATGDLAALSDLLQTPRGGGRPGGGVARIDLLTGAAGSLWR